MESEIDPPPPSSIMTKHDSDSEFVVGSSSPLKAAMTSMAPPSSSSSSPASVLLNSTTEISQVQVTGASSLLTGNPECDVNAPRSEQILEANSSQTLPSAPTQDVSPSKFVPTLGSWAKPLIFKPPTTPPDPSTPKGYDPAIVGNQLAALWPSLNDEILNKQPKNKHPTRSLQLPIEKLPPPELKADGKLRFPWAARLSPQSRNLFRAATPTYRIDGTPEVTIPSKVLKLGPENKDEYVIGTFHKCSLPPGGLVHAVVNRVWGRSCKISCKKISESSYMFHIPHQPTRHWVIQRGVWHIDDCLLFVLPWTPEGSFKVPEVSTIPVWAILKDIPDCCYSRLGISHVASGLGEPILTHKPRLDPTNMGEAKVLVEMELDRAFPKVIALDDKQGNIYLVNVDYTWIPTTCERCGSLGHKSKRCLLPAKAPENSSMPANSDGVNADVPVVDIDLILQQQDNAASSPSTLQEKGSLAKVRPPIVTLPSEALQIQNLYKDLDALHVTHATPATKTINSLHTDLEASQLCSNATYDASMACKDTQVAGHLTTSTTFPSSQMLEENEIVLPSLIKTFSPLVDTISTPTTTPNMDSSPSNIISTEAHKTSDADHLTTRPQGSVFESPSCYTVLGNVDETEIGPSSSLGFTMGGRESKPPIKFQDLEWNTVRGRGKRGRRGRGSTR